MPRGGKRPGAGRKPGSRTRPRAEIDLERGAAAIKRAARQAKADEAAKVEAAKRARREESGVVAEARAEKIRAEILPPLEMPDFPAGTEPLDFLKTLMLDGRLPLGFRRDCAALALPFVHAKPILGLKDARRLAAFDDDLDDGDQDEIANVMRGL